MKGWITLAIAVTLLINQANALLQNEYSCKANGYTWLPNSNYPGTYSFTDDTIGSVPVGFTVSDAGLTAQVNNVYGHNKVLYTTATSGTPYITNMFSSPQSRGTIEFLVNLEQKDKFIAIDLWSGAPTADANNAVFIAFNRVGLLQCINGAGFSYPSNYSTNIWYHMKITFDCATDKYNLYVDNIPILINIPFYGNKDLSTIDRFTIWHQDTGGKIYLDGLSYSWDPNYNIGDNQNGGCCGDDVIDLRKGLVSEWHLDENTGSITYDNISSYQGTISAATWSSTSRAGSSLYFTDAANSKVTTTSPIINTPPYTVCAWVKPNAIDGDYHYIIANGGETGGSYGFFLYLENTGKWVFGVKDSSYYFNYGASVAASGTNWVYLCGSWDGSYIAGSSKLYLNGQLAGLGGVFTSTTGGAGNNLKIGGSTPSDDHNWDGYIDEIRIYNRVLSDKEIEYLYEMSPYAYINYTDTFTNGTLGIDSTMCLAGDLITDLDYTPLYCSLNGDSYITKDWQLESFNYRKNITITSSSALTDYQIPVNPMTYNTTGLVASYHFSEESSIIKDYSGMNNYGNLYGSTVGLWHFDEGSGTSAYDMTINSKTGTINGAQWNTSAINGKSLYFDGSGDYVSVGSITGLTSVNTKTLWIKPNVLSGNVYLIDLGTNNNWIQLYDVESTPDGKLEIRAGSSSGNYIDSNYEITTNNWIFIAVTTDSKNIINIYVNGILDKSGIITPTTPTSIRIGDYGGGGFSFNGNIDEVAVYNNSLSAEQVKSLYYAQKAKFIEYNEGYENKGTGLDFNSASGYIAVPDKSSLRPGSGSFSIGLWFKAPNTDQIGTLFAKRQNGSPYEMYGLAIRGANSHSPIVGKRLNFNYMQVAGSIEKSGYTNRDIADGKWHQAVMVVDDSLQKIIIYVDGKEEPTTLDYDLTWPDLIDNPDTLYIGGSPDTSQYANALIDEVLIYNRALSAQEISDLYNERKGRLDYADLRFYNTSGSELNYYTEYDNVTWVKVPVIPSGNSNITMYYGNPGATSKSSGELTFDFFDDFQGTAIDSSKWAKSGTGSPKVSGSYAELGNSVQLKSNKYFGANYALTYRAKLVNDRATSGLLTPGGTNDWYLSGFFVDSSTVNYIAAGNDASVQYDSSPVNPFINTFRTFEITRSSSTSNTNFYIDNLLEFTNTYGTNINRNVLFSTNLDANDDNLIVDYVRVRKYASTEPTVSTKSEEYILGNSTGLIAHYTFDSDLDNKTIDSVNKNTGSLYGNTLGLWHFDDAYYSPLDSSSYTKNGLLIGDTLLLMHFDEGSGTTTKDETGYGFSGTLTSANWADGVNGKSIIFNSNIVSTTYNLGTQNLWTMSAWIKYTTTSTSYRAIIQTKYQAGVYDQALYLLPSTNGGGIGFWPCLTTNTATVPIGKWTHVAATYDNSVGFKFYMDGVQVATSGVCATAPAWDFLRIGGYGSADAEIFGGYIDEVGVYKRVLTLTEIADLYNSQKAKFIEYNTTAKSGTALNFDGVDDYVSIGSTVMHNIPKGAFSAWIYPTSLSDTKYVVGANAYTGGEFGFRIDTDGGCWWDVNNNYAGQYCSDAGETGDAGTFAVNNWYHVLINWNGTHWALYKNGAPIRTVENTYGTASSTNTNWLGDGWDSSPWQGLIDEVAVYNKSLTQDEVTYLYNSQKAEFMEHVQGSSGKGLEFDGINDYITIPNNNLIDIYGTRNNLTLSAWIKFNDAGLEDIIISKGVYPTYEYRFSTSGTNRFGFNVNSNGAFTEVYDIVVVDKNWHLWTGVYNSSHITLYKDGNRVNSLAHSGIVNQDTNPLIFGRYVGGGFAFNGTLDNIRLYNRALSASEVSELYSSTASNYGCCGDDYVYDTFYNSTISTTTNFCQAGSHINQPIDYNQNICNYYGYNWINENNLISHWKFDETSGSTANDERGTSSMTLYNLESPTDWVTGKYGNALNLDGTNEYLSAPHNEKLNPVTSNLTIAYWIKSTSSANMAVISKSNGGTPTTNYGYSSIMNAGQIWLAAASATTSWGSSGSWYMVSTNTYNDGNWHHVVSVLDRTSNTNSKIYVDGVSVPVTHTGSVSTLGILANTLTTNIGSESDLGFYFAGTLDDVRIYNKALSADEATALYQSSAKNNCCGDDDILDNFYNGTIGTTTNFCQAGNYVKQSIDYNQTVCNYYYDWINVTDGLFYHWRLDEGNGTTIIDDSGKSNAIINGATYTTGKYGSALRFDGTNDYVSPDISALGTTSSITINFWMNRKQDSESSSILVATPDTPSSNRLNFHSPWGDNNWYWDFGTIGSGGRISGAWNPNWYNKWIMYTLVADANGLRFYVNGTLISSGGSAQTFNPSGKTLSIAYYPTPTYVNADLDDLRIYNRALTTDEITSLYQSSAYTGCCGDDSDTTSDFAAEWHFDGGATDTLGSLNPTMYNTPTYTTGVYGSALSLNGVNQYGDIAQNNILDLSEHSTISAWIKTTQTTSGTIFRHNAGIGAYGDNILFRVDSNKIQFGEKNSALAWVFLASTSNVNDGNWHHVAGTFDGSNLRVYVDGRLEATSASFTPQVFSDSSWIIGRYGGSAEYYSGLLDELRVYNRPLSESEINKLYTLSPYAYQTIDTFYNGTIGTTSYFCQEGTFINEEIDANENMCSYYDYTWFTGTGDYPSCCGDDGALDNYFGTELTCNAGVTETGDADSSQESCITQGHDWFTGDGTFNTAVPYITGNSPQSIAVGDFNGDSFLDVVTADYSSNQFSFFAGNGDGTFDARAIGGTTGTQPNSIAVGDFNGDSFLDVVTADYSSNQFSFFAGNGDGTFDARAIGGTTGVEPRAIAVGYLNNDEFLDVVTVETFEPSAGLSFFPGNGDGTFGTRVPYLTGNFPRGVAIGDLDDDGLIDVVTADLTSNQFSFFKNTGNGVFASRVPYTTGSNPRAIAIGDLDNDGLLDVVTADGGSNRFSFFHNTGGAVFATAVPYTTGTTPYSIAVADIDGDSLLDVVTANYGATSFSFFHNTGGAVFATAVPYTTGTNPASIAAGDFNNDNLLDVVTADAGSTRFSYFKNKGISGVNMPCCGDDGLDDDFSNSTLSCIDGEPYADADLIQGLCELTHTWLPDSISGDYPSCCGDDTTDDNFYSSSANCIQGQICSSDSVYGLDMILGTLDDSCGCGSDVQFCEPYGSYDGLSDGVCASNLCVQSGVVSYDGFQYYQGCTQDYECDADIDPANGYLFDGFCQDASCCAEQFYPKYSGETCSRDIDCEIQYTSSGTFYFNADCADSCTCVYDTCDDINSNEICDYDEPDISLNACELLGYHWITEPTTGDYPNCCGNDLEFDLFYNGTISTTNYFCHLGSYTKQPIDSNQTICEHYTYEWINNSISYPAIYTFEKDNINSKPADWHLRDGAFGYILESLDGHANVYTINSSINGGTYIPINQDKGVLEFYLQSHTGDVYIGVVDSYTQAERNNLICQVGFVGTGSVYFSGTTASSYFTAEKNKWHHVKVDYERNGPTKFYLNDELMYETTGGAYAGNYIQIRGYTSNYTIDAVDFSWSNGYFNGRNRAPLCCGDDALDLNTGLITNWHFDEYGGITLIDSKSGYNGTLLSQPARTNGKYGNAIKFNTSNYVSGTGINLANKPFTISAWIKADSVDTARQFFSIGSVAGTRSALHLRLVSPTQFLFGLYNDDLTATIPDITNKWVYLTVTLDDAFTQKIYLNGTLITSKTAGGYFTGNTDWNIGRWVASSGQYFNGTIDEIRVYERALSDSEVQELYNNSPYATIIGDNWYNGTLRNTQNFCQNAQYTTQGLDDNNDLCRYYGYEYINKTDSPATYSFDNDLTELNTVSYKNSYTSNWGTSGAPTGWNKWNDVTLSIQPSIDRHTYAVRLTAPTTGFGKTMYKSTLSTDRWMSFWYKVNDATGNNHFFGLNNGDGWIAAFMQSGTTLKAISSLPYGTTTLQTVNYNQWYHFAINYEPGGNTYFYINGQLVRTQTSLSSLNPTVAYFYHDFNTVKSICDIDAVYIGTSSSEAFASLGSSERIPAGFTSGYNAANIISNLAGQYNVLQINNSISEGNGVTTFSEQQSGTIEFLAKTGTGLARHRFQDATQDLFWVWSMGSDFQFYYGDGAGGLISKGVTVSPDTFHKIKATWDSNTDRYSIWVDDTLEIDNQPFVYDHISNGLTKAVFGVYQGSAYVDNIDFSWASNPNKEAVGCCGDDTIDLQTGLVSGWHLDEQVGTTAIDTIGGINGILIDGPTWTKGKYGNAISLNGVTNYVSVGEPSDFNFQNDFTLSAIIKTTNTNWAAIMDKRDPYTGSSWYRWTINAGGATNKQTIEIAAGKYLNGNTIINDGKYHQLNVVRSGDVINLYVDGVLDATQSGFSGITAGYNVPLHIGAIQRFDVAWFNGVIDEVRVYNRSLSAEEVMALYINSPYSYEFKEDWTSQAVCCCNGQVIYSQESCDRDSDTIEDSVCGLGHYCNSSTPATISVSSKTISIDEPITITITSACQPDVRIIKPDLQEDKLITTSCGTNCYTATYTPVTEGYHHVQAFNGEYNYNMLLATETTRVWNNKWSNQQDEQFAVARQIIFNNTLNSNRINQLVTIPLTFNQTLVYCNDADNDGALNDTSDYLGLRLTRLINNIYYETPFSLFDINCTNHNLSSANITFNLNIESNSVESYFIHYTPSEYLVRQYAGVEYNEVPNRYVNNSVMMIEYDKLDTNLTMTLFNKLGTKEALQAYGDYIIKPIELNREIIGIRNLANNGITPYSVKPGYVTTYTINGKLDVIEQELTASFNQTYAPNSYYTIFKTYLHSFGFANDLWYKDIALQLNKTSFEIIADNNTIYQINKDTSFNYYTPWITLFKKETNEGVALIRINSTDGVYYPIINYTQTNKDSIINIYPIGSIIGLNNQQLASEYAIMTYNSSNHWKEKVSRVSDWLINPINYTILDEAISFDIISYNYDSHVDQSDELIIINVSAFSNAQDISKIHTDLYDNTGNLTLSEDYQCIPQGNYLYDCSFAINPQNFACKEYNASIYAIGVDGLTSTKHYNFTFNINDIIGAYSVPKDTLISTNQILSVVYTYCDGSNTENINLNVKQNEQTIHNDNLPANGEYKVSYTNPLNPTVNNFKLNASDDYYWDYKSFDSKVVKSNFTLGVNRKIYSQGTPGYRSNVITIINPSSNPIIYQIALKSDDLLVRFSENKNTIITINVPAYNNEVIFIDVFPATIGVYQISFTAANKDIEIDSSLIRFEAVVQSLYSSGVFNYTIVPGIDSYAIIILLLLAASIIFIKQKL